MRIQIDPHTLERAEERGTNEEEIKEVIQTGSSFSGKYGRMGKFKVYDFGALRQGNFFHQKRTVYVFYGKWEAEDANSI